MLRLGIRLTLRSGREALVRLTVTAAAVAVGVAILLAVLADFHAFETTSHRPFWEGTTGVARATAASAKPAAGRELWNYSDEVFRGRTIERLDVAALGPGAPVPPGVSRLPAAGQYYASPALAALLRTVPRDQLGARFPGTLAGQIGRPALTGPGELVIYVGRPVTAIATLPRTVVVDKIATAPGRQVWTSYFAAAFAVGALAFVLPILILIGTASKLASARREERYASLRLAGATAGDINVIASADAIISAVLGAAAGIGVFLLVRPALAATAITSARYFSAEVTPTIWGYLGVLIALPPAAAIAALTALRRVRISPLGVSRRVARKPPSAWQLLPLGIGIALFAAGMALTTAQRIGAPALPGLLIVMVGLVAAGPWLTARAAAVLPAAGKAAPIVAARRLADNPRAAFRSVSGLVLAVFLGTTVAGLLPAINATTATPSARALHNVLFDGFMASPVCGNEVNCTGNLGPILAAKGGEGLPPGQGARLVAGLARFRGALTVPIYSSPRGGSVISCPPVNELRAFGQCAPGRQAALVNDGNLFGDNPTFTTKPFVSRSSPAAPSSFAGLPLQAVLIRVTGPAQLERVRTYLITHAARSAGGSAARTFGEAVQARLGVSAVVQRLVDLAVALTLLVAGCSLAVVTGGGLVERKRPFAMLRLSGTPVSTLSQIVLLETLLPLIAAALAAAAAAYGLCALVIKRIAPPGTPLPAFGHVYYATMGAGLVAALLVILATLPLLSKITAVEHVRFE